MKIVPIKCSSLYRLLVDWTQNWASLIWLNKTRMMISSLMLLTTRKFSSQTSTTGFVHTWVVCF